MGVENFECPVSHRRYLWFSKYFNDSLFTEFENSGKENDFNDIDKENLKEFGLIGHGSKIWFNTDDGVLQLLNPGEEVAKTLHVKLRSFLEVGECVSNWLKFYCKNPI